MWSSGGCLHEDVLLIVLVRLPLKAVARFRTVSKSWNALISGPEFIKMHLNHSLSRAKLNLLMFNNGKYDDRRLGGFYQRRRKHMQAVEFPIVGQHLVKKAKIQHSYFYGFQGREKVGCCNGLLCEILPDEYYGFNRVINLFNPLTQSYWELPKRDPEKIKSRLCLYGFGYDDVHDDYKVILTSFHRDSYKINEFNKYEFEVYSMISNSWTIGRCFNSPGMRSYVEGMLVNGALHWLMVGPSSDDTKNCILVFDLRTEYHRFLLVPEVLNDASLALRVLNGSLLVYSNVNYLSASGFDLWWMKDYGSNDSWTRITLHVRIPSSFLPMALVDGMKKLLLYRYEEVVLYDLVLHVVKRINIPGCNLTFYPIHFPFVASLVQPWVTKRQQEAYKSISSYVVQPRVITKIQEVVKSKSSSYVSYKKQRI